jgi:hypothetical protein
LSIEHVAGCAPSIPEVPLRAGAKQNVAPNSDLESFAELAPWLCPNRRERSAQIAVQGFELFDAGEVQHQFVTLDLQLRHLTCRQAYVHVDVNVSKFATSGDRLAA